MSQFNTLNEIFGPVSISNPSEHDNSGSLTNVVYLPGTPAAFLDESWKAGPRPANKMCGRNQVTPTECFDLPLHELTNDLKRR